MASNPTPGSLLPRDYTDVVPELVYDEDEKEEQLMDAEMTDRAGCSSDDAGEGDGRLLSRDAMDVDCDDEHVENVNIGFMLQMDAARHKNMKAEQGNHTTIIVLRCADVFNGVKS